MVTSLTSHPDIHCYREIFLPTNPKPETYRTYRMQSLPRKVAHLFQRKQLIDSYLTDLYAADGNLKALGFKFMYSQAEKLPDVVTWLKDHEVRVIHLIRANTLKKIVSGETAKTRKLYHSTKPVEAIKVRINTRKLKRTLAYVLHQVETYRSVFKDNPYLELTYESFVANRDQETQRLLEFLHIQPPVSLTTDLVKLNPDSLEALIENYDDVVKTLAGTEFERFLL
jgi:hypothetical protein